ncbi:hypothetical protein [Sphingomonas sp. 10B4]|uniref:hypothetical protein n=1 Tax=Sphingomonas sp. 10B4 TaxID=3048575 RepID=UPI002B224C3E|nr:hypothetical protein [Sphingomonas sp. 10B4]
MPWSFLPSSLKFGPESTGRACKLETTKSRVLSAQTENSSFHASRETLTINTIDALRDGTSFPDGFG